MNLHRHKMRLTQIKKKIKKKKTKNIQKKKKKKKPRNTLQSYVVLPKHVKFKYFSLNDFH
jgi:hypothetical protein